MTPRNRLLAARIAFFLYLAAIVWLCFGQFDQVPQMQRTIWGIPTDKIAHFLMFFPFPLLACLAFGGYRGKPGQAVLKTALAFLAGCAFAAGTEWVQTRLPYRSGDPVDFQADALALLLSSVIVLLLVLVKHRK